MRRLPCLHSLLFTLCLAVGLPLPATAADVPDFAPSPTLDRIKRSASITFAYREGAPPFSFKSHDGRVHGYSIDLCDRVALAIQRQLGLAELKVNWIPVTSTTRIAAVATGKADAECGTTTVTLTRMQLVDFSVPIFVDGGSVMIKAGGKLSSLADLNGKKIAVMGATTTEPALRRALNLLDASAALVLVKDSTAGMTMLEQGAVAGFAGDRVVLDGLRLSSPIKAELQILAQDFSLEPYAVVLPRRDPDFRLAVNRALVALYRSGDIDPIFQRWFGGLGEPGQLLHSMFYLNTLPE
jgi:glutamate/aspartate transport system substrate-binding protein